MTMVAALKANDGMVFIGDGKVNDFNHETISEEQVKLFELSPRAILLPANGASDNMDFIMSTLQSTYVRLGIEDVNLVTTAFLNYCNKYVEVDNEGRTPTFTIGGYNISANNAYESQIYLISHTGEEWVVYGTQGDNTFLVQGARGKEIRSFLAEEYTNGGDDSMNGRNILALKAMDLAIELSPQYVGGKISLWNMAPGRDLKRLSDDEILEIRSLVSLDLN